MIDDKKCKNKLSKAKCIFATRMKFIDEIRVFKYYIYITMQTSTSTRVNREIEDFIRLKTKKTAAFALRKDTSTNLLVIGVISTKDIIKIEPTNKIIIRSENGKFYRVNGSKPAFRICIQKEPCFNIGVKTSYEFMEKVCRKTTGSIGFVCPKMSSGKTPFVRGLISLLGNQGKIQAIDGSYNRKNISCFIKLNT